MSPAKKDDWLSGQLQCSKCKETKPLTDYTWRPGRSRPQSWCKKCRANHEVEWRKRSPENLAKFRDNNRKSRLKREFGITAEQYDELLTKQGGVCAVCKKVCFTGRRLAVDHDRNCCPGKQSCGLCVRGLLCAHCNRGIGLFGDSIENIEQVLMYLRRLVV